MDSVKELMDDYLDRNQDAFEEFENPEDVYESIEHHMDNVEVRAQDASARATCMHMDIHLYSSPYSAICTYAGASCRLRPPACDGA